MATYFSLLNLSVCARLAGMLATTDQGGANVIIPHGLGASPVLVVPRPSRTSASQCLSCVRVQSSSCARIACHESRTHTPPGPTDDATATMPSPKGLGYRDCTACMQSTDSGRPKASSHSSFLGHASWYSIPARRRSMVRYSRCHGPAPFFLPDAIMASWVHRWRRPWCHRRVRVCTHTHTLCVALVYCARRRSLGPYGRGWYSYRERGRLEPWSRA